MGVLILTEELTSGNDQLYYNEKENVKLTNVERMNNYIKAYPAIRNRVSKLGIYQFDQQLSQ